MHLPVNAFHQKMYYSVSIYRDEIYWYQLEHWNDTPFSLKNFVIGSNSGHFILYTRMTSDTLQEEIWYGTSTWYWNVHKSSTNQNAANFPKYKNRGLIKYVTNHWFSNIWATQNDLDGMVHVITDFLCYMTDLLPRLKTSEVVFFW